MEADAECQCLLLALPDPCLLAVLECCAAIDQRSVLSAARAHPRLHQAAVLALRSISADVRPQRQVNSVLLYLDRHGRHVSSIDLRGSQFGPAAALRELPSHLQLSSLELQMLRLQLQPGEGFEGLLGAAAGVATLKRLRLDSCKLFDVGLGADGLLAADLPLLPAGLEHLSIRRSLFRRLLEGFFTVTLQQLQQLTYLELRTSNVTLPDSDTTSPALQSLQALTRLVDLRLAVQCDAINITASMLSGTQHLTRLELLSVQCIAIEPGVLAGKTQLQHLSLMTVRLSLGTAGVAQLLSHLQPLQQLTHLHLSSLGKRQLGEDTPLEDTPPAAAYAALTASSKLQHLDLRWCRLPAGVWQHIFAAGRQLPHLATIDISSVKDSLGFPATAPDGDSLVSCCPSLQSLKTWCLRSPSGPALPQPQQPALAQQVAAALEH
jgi:hypothetical protein